MRITMDTAKSTGLVLSKKFAAAAGWLLLGAGTLLAKPAQEAAGGEANLKLPDLSQVTFLGIDGHRLLLYGLVICVFGLLFGLTIFNRLKNMPVHRSMREISELIYETCKTYLVTQGKFLLLLEIFIAAVIVLYFGVLLKMEAVRVAIIIAFSLVGIAGSYGVAWFGIRVNTFANSRTAFASLRGKPYPIYHTPLEAGMSIGMMLISVELLMMLFILLFIPGDYAGPCFIGFAIGESLGAAALRIAGGIFTKIADIGSDLMKIVFKIKEDDARNPGVIADCTGDNAGDSVGPSADGFETYGVTGVALITFILLAVKSPTVQVQLLVWIFVMRLVMLIASAVAYFINGVIAKAKYGNVDQMNYEAPLTSLVWITSFVSIALTYFISKLIIPEIGGDPTQWWKLATIISCGTLAGAIIPELVKVFTSTESRHVQGSCHIGRRRRRIAWNFLGLCSWKFFRILYRPGHGAADVHGLPDQQYGSGRHDARTGGLCVRLGRFRIPGHGTGDHCRGFLRTGHGQRAVGLRIFTDRAGAQHSSGIEERLQHGREFRARQGNARSQRRRGQHLQSHRQTSADRNRGRRRNHHDFLHHHGAYQRPHRKRRQAFSAARALCPRANHRRRDDLLVHRCFHAGSHNRRLSRRGIHQGQHSAGRSGKGIRRRQQEGRRDLH